MKSDWKEAGEEWSAPWGSSAAQWAGTILPRIRDFLPTGAILEIAPGFGRWTHYLKDYCQDLWIVDRSSECIERSEEHTSELQSPYDLVCRLLLEKKKILLTWLILRWVL